MLSIKCEVLSVKCIVQWYHWDFFKCNLINLDDYNEDLAEYLLKCGTFRTSFAAYFDFLICNDEGMSQSEPIAGNKVNGWEIGRGNYYRCSMLHM